MPKFSDRSSERRRAPRTKLVEIAYIGMGPENGGLVLDVSDGGLSFQAVAPVQPAQEIRFLLSLRGHSRIEGAGQVVWTNEMKTVCGLRFTSLSSGAREHLNSWTNQTRTPLTVRRETAKPPAPAKPATPAKAALPYASQSTANASAVPAFTLPIVNHSPLSFPEAKSTWQKPFFLGILFAVLAGSLSVAAFQFGVRIGKSQIISAPQHTDLSEAPGIPPVIAQAPAPARAPAPPISSEANSVPAGAPASPAGLIPGPRNAASAPGGIVPLPALANSAAGDVYVNPIKSEDAPAGKFSTPATKPKPARVPDRPAGQSVESGKSQLKTALAFLNGDNGRKDTPSAVRLLWAAVANGNTEAEITLADLYASGDGIAKNCDQARVLLKAASKTGSAMAEEKLQDLNANGCS